MKLIILALFLSLSLHFLFFASIKKDEKQLQRASTSKDIKKSSIQYVKLMPKKNLINPIKPQEKKVEKKTEKKLPKKEKKNIEKKPLLKKEKPKEYKVVKKEEIKPQKKKEIVTKKPEKITPKPLEKVEIKPTFTKEIPIKPQEKRETITKRSLENFLLNEPIPLDEKMLDDITKSYLRLYGEEYNSFTKLQKVYLEKNLKNIGSITQKYLRYPSLAIRTKQEGMNIVEFFLHPNGDISDLKLTNSSGYTSLDKNSIQTIEIAYKDYPKPKEKTKVKIYVYYKLY